MLGLQGVCWAYRDSVGPTRVVLGLHSCVGPTGNVVCLQGKCLAYRDSVGPTGIVLGLQG